MLRNTLLFIAWATLLLVVFATLSPIGLRPHLAGVSVERFGAFALVGLLFGLVYPGRLGLVLFCVGGAAIGLEIMQHLTPDRHGQVPDALVKLAGSMAGVGAAFVVNRFRNRAVALG
jgi:hypothetical protein